MTVNPGNSTGGNQRITLEGVQRKVVRFRIPALEEEHSRAAEFLPTNPTEGGLGLVFPDLRLSIREQPGLIPLLIQGESSLTPLDPAPWLH